MFSRNFINVGISRNRWQLGYSILKKVVRFNLENNPKMKWKKAYFIQNNLVVATPDKTESCLWMLIILMDRKLEWHLCSMCVVEKLMEVFVVHPLYISLRIQGKRGEIRDLGSGNFATRYVIYVWSFIRHRHRIRKWARSESNFTN